MFEAYKIGVRLSLINHVSHGLRLMAGDFAKTEAQASALQKRITSIQNQAIKGGLIAGVGVGILAMFKAPLDEAKKFDQQFGKFKLFGLTETQNADALKFARTMNTVGTSYVDNLRLMTEAQGVFRQSGLSGGKALEGAKLAAPMLAKIQFATESLDDETKAKMRTGSLAMLRYIEMSGGLKDGQTFNKISNDGWKALQSSGGNINWEQLRQARAKGGTALMNSSARALYGEDEPLIGELKGGAYGDGLMTSYNRLVGAVRVPNQVAHLLAKYKIWDEKKIEWNSQGGIKAFKSNPFNDLDLFSKSRLEFYETKMLPMYRAMHLSENEIFRENSIIFGRTGGRLFNLVHRQRETMHHSADAWDKARGVDGSVTVAGDTLVGKQIALHAQWDKVLADLGTTILPLAIAGVTKLTGALKWADEWINRNQTGTKLLVGSLFSLGASMAFGGTVMLLTAAFRSLGVMLTPLTALVRLAGGLRGIGGMLFSGLRLAGQGLLFLGRALLFTPIGWVVGGIAAAAYLLYRNWSTVGPYVLKTWEIIKAVWHVSTGWLADRVKAVWSVIQPIWAKVSSIFEATSHVAGNAFGRIYTAITGWMGSLFKWFAGTPIGKVMGWTVDGVKAVGNAAGNAISNGFDATYNWAVRENNRAEGGGAASASPYIAPRKLQTVAVHHTIMLDGRKVGEGVVEHIVKESMRPTSGLSGVDPRMSFMSPSMAR